MLFCSYVKLTQNKVYLILSCHFSNKGPRMIDCYTFLTAWTHVLIYKAISEYFWAVKQTTRIVSPLSSHPSYWVTSKHGRGSVNLWLAIGSWQLLYRRWPEKISGDDWLNSYHVTCRRKVFDRNFSWIVGTKLTWAKWLPVHYIYIRIIKENCKLLWSSPFKVIWEFKWEIATFKTMSRMPKKLHMLSCWILIQNDNDEKIQNTAHIVVM